MSSEFELKYDEYVSWYEGARKSFLEPAKVTALRLVEELLDARVESVDRGRFRISTSRVKTAQRSFAKLKNEKYRTRVNAYSDVPDVLDDLVGLRLVCNNLSDINTLQEIVGELAIEDASSSGLAVERDSHRDYFSNPKPSGYRAYHVNLVVPVPQMDGNRRVRVEIQARTLLQDGWGELTHEDSYKPGSTVPEWIVGMSLRMAELLATVDNIAQDLRTGLDVETQRSVMAGAGDSSVPEVAYIADGAAEVVVPTPKEIADRSPRDKTSESAERRLKDADSEIETALLKETRRLADSLTKPTALAVVAQDLNVTFGTEVTRAWGRFGGFKKFLESAVPESLLSGPAPGYIHPPNAPIPDGWTTEDTGTGAIPDLVRELRAYDKGIPLIGAERLDHVIVAVANALHEADLRGQGGNATASQIEVLARRARADAESRERLVVRPHAVYVLQAINRANRIASDVSVEEVRAVLLERIISLAESNALVAERALVEHDLREWLGASPE